MNSKEIGEKAQLIVMGKLAQFDIIPLLPLGDSLPFDFMAHRNGTCKRIQVKSATKIKNGAIKFGIKRTNWYQGEVNGYTIKDCDFMILYSFVNDCMYLIGPEIFENNKNFTIRVNKPTNNQKESINWHEDFIITHESLNNIFGVSLYKPRKSHLLHKPEPKKYPTSNCLNCGAEIVKKKYCNHECAAFAGRKVKNRPTKEELEEKIKILPMITIGKEYNVSDNAVRKWAKSYGINL